MGQGKGFIARHRSQITHADGAVVGPPEAFLSRMRQLLSAAEFDAFVAAFDRPPRVGLRVNTLKISVPDFISIAPFPLAPVGDWEPAGFIVTGDERPGRHPYHDAGLYYLQEPSAMVAAALLAPLPGEMILDLAAAPGGKATHLAGLMAGSKSGERQSALRRGLSAEGLLVANDVHAGRSRLLAENLARWGALNALVTQDEPERIAAVFGPVFDRVLIDAPCSGEGMFRRNESVEWSQAIVAACARRQRGILSVAPELVRPGGRLLYSTCTFAPEENEQVIADFLSREEDWEMVEPDRFAEFGHGRPEWSGALPDVADQLSHAVRLWPHRFPGEGHFLALMQRKGGDGEQEVGGVFSHRPLSGDESRLWREFSSDVLTIDIPTERIFAHNGRLYLRPQTTLPPGNLHIIRYGLLLGEIKPGRIQPAHDLALALGDGDAALAVNWTADDPRLAAYLAGLEPPVSGLPDGWTLVTVDGFGLGWGKIAGGRLKNHYPHRLRRQLL